MSGPTGARRILSAELADITIAYEVDGPEDGHPVILLHGFPDDVRAWDGVVPDLVDAGYRTVTPWLRGYGPTRLHESAQPWDGHLAALASDLLGLLDHLGFERPLVVGHDWGARAAQAVGALEPDRIGRLVSLGRYAIAFGGGSSGPPPYDTLRALWYQWFLTLDLGETILAQDTTGFCRYLWEQWSPGWDFADDVFDETARSFANPDFVPVVVSAYREAYHPMERPDHLERIARRLADRPLVRVPTTVLQGRDDGVDLMETVTDETDLFPVDYEHVVVDQAGHFIHRQQPEAVRSAILGRSGHRSG